jgi:hypothetical protein
MNLAPFTRRLEECRKRWNCRSLQYVLTAARIIRAARKAAKDERRWGLWIRKETHMNRSTIYRYLRVAEFLKANVFSKQHLASLSLAKIYALSRLKPDHARHMIQSGKARRMTDVSFLRLASRLHPKPPTRPILPNLFHALDAALVRLDRSLKMWLHSDLSMPLSLQMKLQTKLGALNKALHRIKRTSAAAM